MQKLLYVITIPGLCFLLAATISCKKNSTQVTPDINTAAPAAPNANEAVMLGTHGFTAAWSTVSTANSYLLYVSENSMFTTHVSGFEGMETQGTQYELTGLLPGSDYYYRVKAKSGERTSGYSNMVHVKTLNDVLTDTLVTYNIDGTAVMLFHPCPMSMRLIPPLITGGECGNEFERGFMADCGSSVTTFKLAFVSLSPEMNINVGNYDSFCSFTGVFTRLTVYNGSNYYGIYHRSSPGDYCQVNITEKGTNYIKGTFTATLSNASNTNEHVSVTDGQFKVRVLY